MVIAMKKILDTNRSGATMTTPKTISSELGRAFDILNARLFGGALKKPDFSLVPKKKLIFRFLPETYQMMVGGDLVKVDTQALLVHLLHEMVHVSNYTKGVVDCRSNQYHNKEFMQAAVKVGLTCLRHRNHGWVTTITAPSNGDVSELPSSDDIERRIKAFDEIKLDKAVLRQTKIEFGDLGKRNRQSIYFLKYECQCPPPHNSIRSGRRPDGDHPLNIHCMDCKSAFVCVDL